MKYEEYENLINEALENPDKATASFKDVLTNLKTDITTLTTQAEKISEQEKRIRDLQDTNMKLFLSQTGQRKEEKEEPEEKTGQDAIDEFIAKITEDKDE